MRKKLCALLALLFMLTLQTPVRSEGPALGDTVYGSWTIWSVNRPQASSKLEVESREVQQQVLLSTWSYRRYVYYNTKAGSWYATSTDQVGDVESPGTGRWEEKTFPEPLEPIGMVGGEQAYQGQWFFENQGVTSDGYRTVTQYRSRSVSRKVCELSVHEVALARGDSYALSYQLTEDVKRVWFRSSDTGVATVDQQGVVTARGIGTADIDVMLGMDRVERLRLAVGDRIAGLQSGAYSIQLIGTDRYLSPMGAKSAPGTRLCISNLLGSEQRLFRFLGVAEKSFQVRLENARLAFLSIKGQGGLTLQGTSKKYDQAFSILRLEGGQDLIHLTSDPTKFLTAMPSGLVELQPFDMLSTTQRWKLSKQGEDAAQESGVWIVPYVRDGKCYVTANFIEGEHKGLDIGTGGERVSALSVAAGKVVHVYAGCPHDYGKKPDENGEPVDPCGGTNSFGNIVIVEHANGIQTAYAHLSRVLVREGDRVRQGDVVGIIGSTGSSTAVHLHFEVRVNGRQVNPRQYIAFPKSSR